MRLNIQKIVSGGQTGVDRAALDVAMFLGIPHGGWCPKGRLAEDGVIPEIYQLRETDSKDYPRRTEQNVIDSDGTLILHWDRIRGGTLLTVQLAKKHRRSTFLVDLADPVEPEAVRDWIQQQNIGVLNIAGPRASSESGIGQYAESFLCRVFSDVPQ